MQKYSLHRTLFAFVVAALCILSLVALGSATSLAAPVAQDDDTTESMPGVTRAQEVQGNLPGGQFAKIWLGLEPATSGAQIEIISEWDTPNPADKGINFFILDENGLRNIGDGNLSGIALGAGSANYVLNGPENVLGASFNAVGLADYTVVVANDSNQDANFTLRVNNGFILDDSNQVTDPNATPAPAETTDEEGDDAADETATDDATTDEATTDEAAVTATATPAATTAITATDTTTDTGATETVAEEAPAATVSTGGVVRTTSLSGSLPEQNDQHFLGLEPNGRDVQVTLRLTIEPQDNSELARRLNFWVLDPAGFNQYLGGSDPSDVAIAAGNRVFRGQDNERVASFQVAGSGSYTVIVYNNATVPGTYELTIENGLLIDDSGQTNESMASGTAVGATGTSTATVETDATGTVTGTASTTTTATTATESTTTTATRTGEPGGSYTVQSGDTLALIARDIYGDLGLYEELCAFNNIANCNVIEVGDVIQLPTQAQISSGATAPAATTSTAAPTATPAATTADDAVEADDAAETDSTDVATTDTMTDTEMADDTATDDTATDDAASTDEGSSASGDTIYQTLVDNGNFTTLVNGLEAAGLDSALDSSGEMTLFAPTDAAFVTLRNRFSLTEDQLLGLPELGDVLQYHVVSGNVDSGSLSDGMSVATLQGADITIGIDGDTVTLNGTATLIATDVETANGIIHVIDTVILPPTE